MNKKTIGLLLLSSIFVNLDAYWFSFEKKQPVEAQDKVIFLGKKSYSVRPYVRTDAGACYYHIPTSSFLPSEKIEEGEVIHVNSSKVIPTVQAAIGFEYYNTEKENPAHWNIETNISYAGRSQGLEHDFLMVKQTKAELTVRQDIRHWRLLLQAGRQWKIEKIGKVELFSGVGTALRTFEALRVYEIGGSEAFTGQRIDGLKKKVFAWRIGASLTRTFLDNFDTVFSYSYNRNKGWYDQRLHMDNVHSSSSHHDDGARAALQTALLLEERPVFSVSSHMFTVGFSYNF